MALGVPFMPLVSIWLETEMRIITSKGCCEGKMRSCALEGPRVMNRGQGLLGLGCLWTGPGGEPRVIFVLPWVLIRDSRQRPCSTPALLQGSLGDLPPPALHQPSSSPRQTGFQSGATGRISACRTLRTPGILKDVTTWEPLQRPKRRLLEGRTVCPSLEDCPGPGGQV